MISMKYVQLRNNKLLIFPKTTTKDRKILTYNPSSAVKSASHGGISPDNSLSNSHLFLFDDRAIEKKKTNMNNTKLTLLGKKHKKI